MGRLLMTAGAAIFIAGAAVWLASRFGGRLGRLPGDISIEGKNFKVYAPITSMIIASVVLSIVLNVISRLRK
ncbi:MAG: DUF2905 domain-containing protein [Synergistaceae bacterium]|nr:DUF2905 domain-containing protein [Synergistaceae bacterium]